MNPELIFKMLESMPGFKGQTLEQQSAAVSGVEKMLTTWLQDKKRNTLLKDNEVELVLMFREVDNQLLMIPTVFDENDKMCRFLIPQSINVTQMCKRVPAFDILPALIAAGKNEKDKDGGVKVMQKVITALRSAANHPSCRLEAPAPIEETPYQSEVAKEIKAEAPEEVLAPETAVEVPQEKTLEDKVAAILGNYPYNQEGTEFEGGDLEIDCSNEGLDPLIVPKNATSNEVATLREYYIQGGFDDTPEPNDVFSAEEEQ